jgi:hypothetical protein
MRPWRSSSAPAIGLTSRPGNTLANVTIPASAAESNSSSVNSTSAMLTIDCATRAICIDSRTRHSVGTRSSARYDGSSARWVTPGDGV